VQVYFPCILETKKRYVGMAKEHIDQAPVFDAKGIETVRRDGCPAVAKILEKSLRILFENRDVSAIKQYFLHQVYFIIFSDLKRQCIKLLEGRVNTRDFIFAKVATILLNSGTCLYIHAKYTTAVHSQEYRGREQYSPRACVPALEIARTLSAHDARAEPLVHERVPYVIVCGKPDATLIQLVRQPHMLLSVSASIRRLRVFNGLSYCNRYFVYV
jgi:DNA polymerase zeta